MANFEYQIKDGNSFNRPPKELEFSTTDIVTADKINDYMSNNGSRYSEAIKFVPQGSIGCLGTPDTMYVAKFYEDEGDINTEYNRPNGVWKLLASVPWIKS